MNPRAQVITAAGEGSAAAIAINNDLVDEDAALAVAASGWAARLTPPSSTAPPSPHRRSITMSDAHPSAPTSSTSNGHPGPADVRERPPDRPSAPPSKHQLALMIWIAVFPTLTVLNLALGPWLADLAPVLRTFVLATIAVPIVIYGLMPRLHRVRAHILTRHVH